jgi:hypothetical protein
VKAMFGYKCNVCFFLFLFFKLTATRIMVVAVEYMMSGDGNYLI